MAKKTLETKNQDFSKEIEKYEQLLEKRIEEKNILSEKLTNELWTVELDYKNLSDLRNDLKQVEWQYQEAIYLENLDKSLSERIDSLKNSNKTFSSFNRKDIETILHFLQSGKNTGINKARRYSKYIKEILKPYFDIAPYKSELELLEKSIKSIEFKIASYNDNIEPAKESKEIESMVDNGTNWESITERINKEIKEEEKKQNG